MAPFLNCQHFSLFLSRAEQQNFILLTCDMEFAPTFLMVGICPRLHSADTGGSGRTYCMHLNVLQYAGYAEHQSCSNKLHLQAYRWISKLLQGSLQFALVYLSSAYYSGTT